MTVDITICHQCGQPATKTLCAHTYCHTCAETILAPIRERQITREPSMGIGIPSGPHLECDLCGASWVGEAGEECEWCLRWLELALEQQRAVLLRPELPDPDDQHYQPALDAWIKRLAAAVDAELITETEARRTLERNTHAT